MCNYFFISFLKFVGKVTISGSLTKTHFTLISGLVLLIVHNPYAAVLCKNAVSANTKHGRYFHQTSHFRSIHNCSKRLYVHMFDVVDTAFSYGRALIICLLVQESSKVKESSLHEMWMQIRHFYLVGKYGSYNISSYHIILYQFLLLHFFWPW